MVELKRYELSEPDFENFRRLINQASGIYFDRGKREVLRLGLSDRAEALAIEDLHDYYQYLLSGEDREQELRSLLNHLSVQETHFFRNMPQFDALRKFVIPEIARRKAAGHRKLKFWSAGCSTGQEVYTIAMSLYDVLPDPTAWDIQIMGTDLNEEALDIARKGWYPERKSTGLDREHMDSYFIREDGGFRVRDELRKLTHFSRHNMVTESLPIDKFGTCDVIFCRNVIIYFTHQTAKHVIELFYDILNPGGYLFLGHSETLWKMSAKYSLVEMGDAFIYKKSLPRSMNGRRFIPDRRMRQEPLPPGVEKDRRKKQERRDAIDAEKLIAGKGEKEAGAAAPAEGDNGDRSDAISRCRKFLDLGEYDSAIKSLEEARSGMSTDAESYYLLALALEKKGDLDEALEAFRKSIYCDHTYSLAYFHVANVLEQRGELQSAVKEYRNAAGCFSHDDKERWEKDLEAFDLDSLIDLCQWKIENLGSAEN